VIAWPGDRTDQGGAHEADVAVEVRAAPAPVLMHEPEATWLGTFVRRAAQGDRGIALRGRTQVSPRVSVARGQGAVLTREALATVGTVLVTVPEALREAEVDLLDRFARVRGGSVVLLPDRKPSGPIGRLMPPIVEERRATYPQPIGPLRARELLIFDRSAPGLTVLESSGDAPVIVSRAIGRGRVIVSGALDAWRYRDTAGQFAGFWSSLVADAYTAAGSTVDVEVLTPVVARGGEARLLVDWRSLDDIPDEVGVQGAYRCGADNGVVRLWPGPRRGMFAGAFQIPSADNCAIEVTIDGVSDAGRAALSSMAKVTQPPPTSGALEGAVAAHGGLLAAPGNGAVLVSRVRERLPVEREPQRTRPMRSPWWIVPFAICLGGEWWLRRKQGLR
jgi:hypothetical protein